MTAEKKVVIITGASSGIGSSLVEVFAKKKYKVVIAARDNNKLEVIREKLVLQGCEVLSVICDVSREDDCKKLIEITVNNNSFFMFLFSTSVVKNYR